MIIFDMINSFMTILQSTGTGIELNPGEAFDNLRQNNTVVGLLYLLVIAQAGVIVKLWLKLDKVNEARIEDLKHRLKVEEELKEEIEKIKLYSHKNQNDH